MLSALIKKGPLCSLQSIPILSASKICVSNSKSEPLAVFKN